MAWQLTRAREAHPVCASAEIQAIPIWQLTRAREAHLQAHAI